MRPTLTVTGVTFGVPLVSRCDDEASLSSIAEQISQLHNGHVAAPRRTHLLKHLRNLKEIAIMSHTREGKLAYDNRRRLELHAPTVLHRDSSNCNARR